MRRQTSHSQPAIDGQAADEASDGDRPLWVAPHRDKGSGRRRWDGHRLRPRSGSTERSTLLAEGAPVTSVAGHLGDTVETLTRVYAHWLRDDRDVPAEILDRVLAPAAGDQLATTAGI